MLPLSAISSGHVRYKGKVYKTDELNIKEIYVNPDDKDRYFCYRHILPMQYLFQK